MLLGEQSFEQRQVVQAQFMSQHFQILCAQVAVGSHGIDLSVADTAIYYSNTYSAEKRGQSEDRIVHPQKTHPVLYIDLVTNNTVDQDCETALREKRVHGKLFTSALRAAHLERRQRSAE
jgi:superfamily II DNA or RNA helicase